VELQLEVDGGVKRWVRLESVARGEPGAGLELFSTVSDITEHRKQEERRKSLERQFLQAQKLESLGVMAGGIAHDFNNLMATVMMRADLAAMDLPGRSPIRRHLEGITQVTERAAALAGQMLDFAGHKGFAPTSKIDLTTLVAETLPMVAAASSKKIEIERRFASTLPRIEGDASRVGQVVLNLLTNAADAIGADRPGVITLTTGVMTCGREFLAHCVVADKEGAGDYVYLQVSDTGCGMGDEVQAKIFDPFFTTKAPGRGLGLAAVLGIVRSHGGALRLCSAPGQGTTIRVLFPFDDPTSSPPAVATHQPQGPERLEGTILVVDDEGPLLEVLRLHLGRFGLRVLTAADGEEGVAVFRDHAEEIDLVLLDRSMPRLSGPEALVEMRRLRGAVPAILMSGFGQDLPTDIPHPGEKIEFLPKPFQMSTLRQVVARLLERGPLSAHPEPRTP
jgi:signal transduction histidine kinase/CheY-like chemotaxis protein